MQKSVSGNQREGCNAIIDSYKFGKNNFNESKSVLTFHLTNRNGALALTKSMQDQLLVHVFSKASNKNSSSGTSKKDPSKQLQRPAQLYMYHGLFKVVSKTHCGDLASVLYVLASRQKSKKTKTKLTKPPVARGAAATTKVDVYEFTLQLHNT